MQNLIINENYKKRENKMKNLKDIVNSIMVFIMLIGGFYYILMPIGGEFGKKSNVIERDVYETNPQYIKGIADDIAKYMYEYNTTDDEAEQQAVCQVVNHRFADFDLNDLNDKDLRDFARGCRMG